MESNSPISFLIKIMTISGNRATVDGYCWWGPIYLGQRFTTVSSMTVIKTPEVYGPTILYPIAAVDLRIESIMAYRHQLDDLYPGMSARLELSGSGVENLGAELVLT